MTQCKIKVNLGFKKPYKWEITFLHNQKKIKKLRTSDIGEINLKQTDFFESSKFVSGLPNDYFLFEKKVFFACQFYLADLTACFAF